MIKEIKIFERLKNKNEIESVYKNGSVIVSTDRKLKAYFLSTESKTNNVKFAVSVSSKTGNSVWRNRLKRIIRESLQQGEEILKERIFKSKLDLSIIFSPNQLNQNIYRYIFLKDIKPAVADILNRINKTIIRN